MSEAFFLLIVRGICLKVVHGYSSLKKALTLIISEGSLGYCGYGFFEIKCCRNSVELCLSRIILECRDRLLYVDVVWTA